jgi:hypothetical protein
VRRELEEIIALIESRCQARPTPMEFEMAYQARVAADGIRFAIKHAEQFAPHTDEMRQAGLQLLDALERLENIDRRFQRRSRLAPASEENANKNTGHARRSETSEKRTVNQPNGRAENQTEYAGRET